MSRKSKREKERARLRKQALKRRVRIAKAKDKTTFVMPSKHYFQLKGKEAENILNELAEKTFLTDWCYPNPVLPNGNELCDLLVVFDDTAIIWQLKDTKLDDHGNLKESDVKKNQRQLLGACRQLFELQTAITLTNPRRGSEVFDPSQIKNIHLISAFFGDTPTVIRTSEKVDDHFIHTHTRDFTEIVLNELDTISDFQKYLCAREDLANAGTGVVVVGGEEDVLAYYLQNNRSFDQFHGKDFVILKGDIWVNLKDNPKYQAKKKADEVSYLWDGIIDRSHEGDSEDYELIARELARHDRFGRRMLGKAFLDAHMMANARRETFRRLMLMEDWDVVYCFLFQDDPEPRENRKGHLAGLCHVARSKHRDKKIIGIATEATFNPTCSYDFALFTPHEWTEADQKLLEKIEAETDILKNPRRQSIHEDEYPELK